MRNSRWKLLPGPEIYTDSSTSKVEEINSKSQGIKSATTARYTAIVCITSM